MKLIFVSYLNIIRGFNIESVEISDEDTFSITKALAIDFILNRNKKLWGK